MIDNIYIDWKSRIIGEKYHKIPTPGHMVEWVDTTLCLFELICNCDSLVEKSTPPHLVWSTCVSCGSRSSSRGGRLFVRVMLGVIFWMRIIVVVVNSWKGNRPRFPSPWIRHCIERDYHIDYSRILTRCCLTLPHSSFNRSCNPMWSVILNKNRYLFTIYFVEQHK